MGEQKKKDTVCPFSFVKEPKQGVLRVNYSRSKTTMRREWDVVRTRNVNQPNDKGENKEYRAYALAYDRDDYIFDCAMKNPTRNHRKALIHQVSRLFFCFFGIRVYTDLFPSFPVFSVGKLTVTSFNPNE